MRDAFFAELLDLYKADQRVVFLTGDLGYKLFDRLVEADPDRVMNVGLREAGMVGVASGLAHAGMLPFVYSITPFVTLRCLEQVKLDFCYNQVRAVLVGVGGGYSYGANGPTHHGVDDIGVLSCLPGLRVWTPADPMEVRACVRAVAELSGPAYLRLGRNGEPCLHPQDKVPPPIGAPVVSRNGTDGTLLTCGVILHEVLKAAELLKEEGCNVRVVHVPTLRPFPAERLLACLAPEGPVLTVEEHVSVGGLGQETAVLLAQRGVARPFRMLSIPMAFQGECLSRDAALAWAGIDAPSIAEAWRELAGT